MNAERAQDDQERLTIELTLRFDGRVPKEGLDADEVAAVADGMAKAVQLLAELASDEGRKHVLHLQEVRPGSATFKFLLELAAVTQTILPTILEGQFSLRNTGEIFSQALKLLEFLKGKPPQATQSIDGSQNVMVTNSEGASVVVYVPVYNVAGNAYFQDQAAKVVRPLRKDGRTLALAGTSGTLFEAASESYDAITSRPLNDNQILSTNTIEATLRVRQPHLESEDSWRFLWGRNAITAKVTDAAFMERVRSGTQEFRSGDVLRVKLRICEERRGKNVVKRHFIDEVLTHERGT